MAELLTAFSQNDFRECFEAWRAHILPMEITWKGITCRYINFINKVCF
jgi:hypothetical protein